MQSKPDVDIGIPDDLEFEPTKPRRRKTAKERAAADAAALEALELDEQPKKAKRAKKVKERKPPLLARATHDGKVVAEYHGVLAKPRDPLPKPVFYTKEYPSIGRNEDDVPALVMKEKTFGPYHANREDRRRATAFLAQLMQRRRRMARAA